MSLRHQPNYKKKLLLAKKKIDPRHKLHMHDYLVFHLDIYINAHKGMIAQERIIIRY